MRCLNISEVLSRKDPGAQAANIGDSLVIFEQHMKMRYVMSILEHKWDCI
jgi:hypothetical protein